ncbi:MAG: tetratricopeptide repeat protein, partial [Gemmatimonadota bacterium]
MSLPRSVAVLPSYRLAVVLGALLVAASHLPAQSPPADLEQKALGQFQAGQWADAATSYAELLKSHPEGVQSHFRLGVALLRTGHAQEAIGHFTEAERLGAPAPRNAWLLGKAHAALGHRDAAFRELKRATDAGFLAPPTPIEQDPDLKALADDPRLQQVKTALATNATPCLHNAENREFDFWIGTWDVRPNGQPTAPAATNIITLEHDGCVIHESWSAPGSTGQSFNIYDSSVDKWNQTWVDNSGGLHEYWGNLKDGNMLYEGSLAPLPGTTTRVRTRLTFFHV